MRECSNNHLGFSTMLRNFCLQKNENYEKFVDTVIPSHLVSLILDFKPYDGLQKELNQDLMFFTWSKKFYDFWKKISKYPGICFFEISITNEETKEYDTKIIYDNPNRFIQRYQSTLLKKYEEEMRIPLKDLVNFSEEFYFESCFIPTSSKIRIEYEGFIGNFGNYSINEDRDWENVDRCFCGNRETFRLDTDFPFELEVDIIWTNVYSNGMEFSFCNC